MKQKQWIKLSLLKIALLTSLLLSTNTQNNAYALIEDFQHNFTHEQSQSFLTKAKNLLNIRNWGLFNSNGSHINAKKAWEITQGDRSIVVAVIDTGIDAKHPDLKDNLWHNSSTDEYGWDFVLNRKNPIDEHGHGSHVAGIIGATAKTNSGALGVARKVSIMAIRYYSKNASGAQNLSNTIKAINYAVDHGARIINYSGGGAEFSAGEFQAIKRAEKKGILFIAAAGNEYQNTDIPENKYYPSAYGLSNIISVAATDINNRLLSSSNWGIKTVDVAAPGDNIYSTLPKGNYGYLSGTSQATAFVSGLAALILSENPKLTPTEVKAIIVSSVDKLSSLKGKIASGGRINAYKAVQLAANTKENSFATYALNTRDDLNSEMEKRPKVVTFERKVARDKR